VWGWGWRRLRLLMRWIGSKKKLTGNNPWDCAAAGGVGEKSKPL
jgi:hypothetical protein